VPAQQRRRRDQKTTASASAAASGSPQPGRSDQSWSMGPARLTTASSCRRTTISSSLKSCERGRPRRAAAGSGPAGSKTTRSRTNSSEGQRGGRLYGRNSPPEDGTELTHPTRSTRWLTPPKAPVRPSSTGMAGARFRTPVRFFHNPFHERATWTRCKSWINKKPRFAGPLQSPLTDSNRRPLLTMEVSGCHARTRATIRDTLPPATRTDAGGGDASRDVARVVSDVSVLCPRRVNGRDNENGSVGGAIEG